MRGSRVLVVGGAGFVGSALCRRLLCTADVRELWVIDNLLSSERSTVPDDPRLTFLLGSVTDDQLLRHLPRELNYVFHLACYHGNQSSIADPLADHENGAFASLKLFEGLKHTAGLRSVVYAAAGCAVAEKTQHPAKATPEEAPVSLFHDSPYSISKLIGELYGNYYFLRHDLPFIRARFQNVYGPGEILGAGRWRGTPHTVWRNVIPTFIWKALHGERLPLDNEGKGGRDFIFVEDIARGLIACAEKGKPGEAYNLASGVETSILWLATEINRLTGNAAPLDLRPARDWDRSGRRMGDPTKSRNELGFEAEISLPEGLSRTVEWTRANRDLITAAVAKHAEAMAAA